MPLVILPNPTSETGQAVEVDDEVLEEVSRLYAEGGEPAVRTLPALAEGSAADLDFLIARALHAYPLDYERIEMVEGVHDGLVARAHRQSLHSADPQVKARAVELSHKQKGRLRDMDNPATRAVEAITHIIAMVTGNEPIPDEVKARNAADQLPE